ncbi:MAG: hypothetical protein FWD90_08445 [Defluviitaleaceae bacterium]|nr:hypothetical protein [Defluviitaleaceae bacterium]
MKRDELDNKYKEAFGQAPAPSPEEALAGIQAKMAAKRPARFNKRNVAALFAACLLLFTTMISAQAYYRRGGFEWLSSLLGSEEAAWLQPIGFANRDFDDIYRVGSTTTEDGVYVELVAIGVDGDYVDVYLLLEDLTGKRNWNTYYWQNDTDVFHYLRFTDRSLSISGGRTWGSGSYSPDNRGHSTSLTVIDRDEASGQVLLHSRMSRPSLDEGVDIGDANPRALTYNIVSMAYNLTDKVEREIPVNLPELLKNPATLGTDRNITRFYYLLPNIPDTSNGADRVASISAIHYDDGLLRLQFRNNGGAFIIPFFINAEGERIEPLPFEANAFNIDDQGELYMPLFMSDERGNALAPTPADYWEFLFAVRGEDIGTLRLHGTIFNSGYIPVNWAVDFILQGGTDLPSPRPTPLPDAHIWTGPHLHELMDDPDSKQYLGDWLYNADGSMTISIRLPGVPSDPESVLFVSARGEIFRYGDLHLLPTLLREYILYFYDYNTRMDNTRR